MFKRSRCAAMYDMRAAAPRIESGTSVDVDEAIFAVPGAPRETSPAVAALVAALTAEARKL